MADLNPAQFPEDLKECLKTFDKKGAADLCRQLIQFLFQSRADFPHKEAERILQQLRNKRMFDLMQSVADALILTGRHTFKIRRQYAQSLIDQGNLTAALAVLASLIVDTSDAAASEINAKPELAEAKGLRGRVYKQLYLNTQRPPAPGNEEFIRQAIQSYYEVYLTSPAEYTWHGINVTALLCRASSDGLRLEGYPDYREIATTILEIIEDKHLEKRADTYDFATAAEACIALDRPSEAEKWIAWYAADAGCDAFEIGSTLRQFEEVWKLDLNAEGGQLVLPILRSSLLQREGGKIILESAEVQLQKTQGLQLEKNFGNNVFIDFRTYKKGFSRCELVARIGRAALIGDGTGFLMKGSDLSQDWGDDLILLTNAHVISSEPEVIRMYGSLQPEEVVITFEALDRDEEFSAGRVLWSSPPDKLDVSVVAFAPADRSRLERLTKDITLYKEARVLPAVNSDQRIYVIGHPKGGTLQFSLQDNLLLDHQDPRIHYRTPTEGGNSGSPIFNQQWDLIGIHHAGSEAVRRLNGNEGTYAANEGMWIASIKKAINDGLHGITAAPPSDPPPSSVPG